MIEHTASHPFTVSRRERGFTLIEAMIAFLVLAGGIVALLSFHAGAQRANAEAKTRAEAVAYAEAKLKQLESYLHAADARLVDGSDTLNGQTVEFEREWTLTQNTPDGSLQTADVTVTWIDRSGQTQQVVLSAEIHVREPASGVENLLTVVRSTRDQHASGWYRPGGPSEDDEPQPDGDTGDPDGDQGEEPGDDQVHVDHYTLIIEGNISKDKQSTLAGVAGDGNFLPACSFQIIGETAGIYRCAIQVAKGSLWTGGITFTTNKVICSAMSGQYSSRGRKVFNGVGSDQRFDLVLAKNKQGC